MLELENKFHLGCNYLASHAGCFMWQQWDENAVDKDFALFAANNVRTLRVFPLWPDFQPLNILYGEFGCVKEVRMREEPLGSEPHSQACVDPVMIKRFEKLCELAEKHGLNLTVMLLTGWLSGRQFKPEPLQALNTYTDPISLKWQVKFVKYFVEHFKKYSAIIGWGLGNESNVMSSCRSSEAAFTWTALISNTIRAVDSTRPVISGMHGLTVGDPNNPWRIEDQGQLCDIVTTHPYAIFVKYCQQDPLTNMRTTLHPAAESTLYSDISGKQCFAEEIGDLGKALVDNNTAKTYLDTILWSCWANNNLGCLWWCAFQQDGFQKAPYDWFKFEQDLGLFYKDRNPKPVVKAINDFQGMLDSLPSQYQKLPVRHRDAVCILTQGQEQWATAFSTFVLAKQAGFDVKFIAPDTPIPNADLYILPSLCGYGPLSNRNWEELLRNVRDRGACLYLSVYDALLSDLETFAGLKIMNRQAWRDEPAACFVEENCILSFPPNRTFTTSHREGGIATQAEPFMFTTRLCGAEVIATDSQGLPMFTRHKYGTGEVFFLNFGLEMVLSKNGGVFCEIAPDYSRFYETFAANILDGRLLQKKVECKFLALTEHYVDRNKIICTGTNHSLTVMNTELRINNSVRKIKILHGDAKHNENTLCISIPSGRGFVVELSK